MKKEKMLTSAGKHIVKEGGIKNGFKIAKIWCTKYNSEILIGMGLTGMCTAVCTSAFAAVKASKKIEKYKEENDVETMTKTEILKETWTAFIPTTALVLTSGACILYAHKIKSDKMSALATALAMSEKASEELIEKAKGIIGEEKVEEIKKEVNLDRTDIDISEEDIIRTGDGDDLFYDETIGRFFYSSQTAIREAANRVNMELMSDMKMELNELYDELRLDSVIAGRVLGWDIDDGLIEPRFDSMITRKGRPCITVSFQAKALVRNY